MARPETSINVSPSTHDKIREMKGFDRTYDELLSQWAEEFSKEGGADGP